jgi:hypothetical protein
MRKIHGCISGSKAVIDRTKKVAERYMRPLPLVAAGATPSKVQFITLA